ncbi:MAG: aspartate aminotransferase family protein [Actinomycetia bacterium]|nr:aspartate aminotransferase family protein [Actinomycetes bacterium]MCP3911270.1 aspartate aminotransferase family protein [Actinomycetes bacterium]MCP4084430.1 aspartate aminotransferase family protein [Actinomycetes bacterium]
MPITQLHPFSSPAKEDFIKIVKGKGSLVWDDSGKEYVDGMANLWLCQVGHGRQEINDAVADQMGKIAGYNTFDPFTNEAADAVAAKIASVSPHPDGRVFLANSGSEAVDTALKLARLHHQRRGEADRQIIVRRTHGYHGTNVGGTSVQGIAPNREGWGDLLPHVMEIPSDDIEVAAQMFSEHGSRIAAVISEPVQGAGGVIVPPDGYLQGLRRLCDQHGALLIADEVICGFGRTGSWFGSQTYGVTPDLMTFAKGVSSGYLPLSGVILSRDMATAMEDDGFLFRHGYTYSGHPAACAAGLANLEIIEREGLVDRANHVGEVLSEGLRSLQDDGLIESYRGVGAIWAAEFGRDTTLHKMALVDKGAILRPVGTCVTFCPPLVTPDDQLVRLTDAVAEVFA